MYLCAWCNDLIPGRQLRDPQAVGHGICHRCLDQQLAQLSRSALSAPMPLVRNETVPDQRAAA